jgi:hypothetical protein
MNVALLLGAGFSRWAARLPVACELFDFAIEPWGRQEKRKLALAKSLKEAWYIAHPEGQAEQFIAAALGFPEKDREAVLWYISRRLSEGFIWKEFHGQRWRRHVLMIDENRRHQIDGVIRATRYLKAFLGPSFLGIITTNYDLLVEYALGTRGFNYGIPNQVLSGRGPYPVSQWRNPVRLTGPIPLAKIHGSISWDEYDCYTDGRQGLTGRALVVAPVPEKTQPAALKSRWELAEKILNRATHLVVFGFAFNPYDEAVLNLLRSASANIKSVQLIDKQPPIERAQSLWPDAQIAASLPPEGAESIHTWSTQ